MSLIGELKRRGVVRVAIAYLAAAWLITEVAGTVLPAFAYGEAELRVIIIALAIALVPVLILTWIFEVTPEGIVLDKDREQDQAADHFGGRRLDFIIISLLAAAVLMFAWDKWWAPGLSIQSLAVLPINALSADPEMAYVADGMTEMLIGELGRIDGLRVNSRTSAQRYKASDKTLPEIARELNVDAVLEGSLQPFGDSLRIGLHLVDGRNDKQIWSGNFDRGLGDLLTLQGEVARLVASEINISLSPEDEAYFKRERTISPDAFRHWAIGNHHLRSIELDKALASFERAVELDPEYAEAYSGIAQVYSFMGSWWGPEKLETVLPHARKAVNRALELDPELADAHFSLAGIHLLDWNWAAAERAFRNGVRLNPSGNSLGLSEFANFLTAVGRASEGIDMAKRAVDLDLVDPVAHVELAHSLQYDGQLDASLEQYRLAQQLDPDFIGIHLMLAEHYILVQKFDRAIPHLEQLDKVIDQLPPSILGFVGLHWGRVGQAGKTSAILAQLKQKAETEFVAASSFAFLYIGLGEKGEALNQLELGYEERNPTMLWLREDVKLEPLRDELRYQALVRRMNFPD